MQVSSYYLCVMLHCNICCLSWLSENLSERMERPEDLLKPTWIQNSCASLQKGLSWFCLISAKSYRPTSCKSLGENEHEYWCMHAPWSHLQSALIFYPLKSRRCKSHQESPWQPDITGCWTMAVISWECWQSRVELQVAVINI